MERCCDYQHGNRFWEFASWCLMFDQHPTFLQPVSPCETTHQALRGSAARKNAVLGTCSWGCPCRSIQSNRSWSRVETILGSLEIVSTPRNWKSKNMENYGCVVVFPLNQSTEFCLTSTEMDIYPAGFCFLSAIEMGQTPTKPTSGIPQINRSSIIPNVNQFHLSWDVMRPG